MTGLPWSGKSRGNSSLSQSQGKVREFCCKSGNFIICYQSQGKVREFCLWCLSMHIFHRLANDIWTRTKSSIRFSFKYHLPNDCFLNFICFHVLHDVQHKIPTIFMMLKMFSCADLFLRPLCWSIYWWIMWFLCSFQCIAKITTGYILRQWLEFVFAVREMSGKSQGIFFCWPRGNPEWFCKQSLPKFNHCGCSSKYKNNVYV